MVSNRQVENAMKNRSREKLTAIEKTLEILISFADNDRELGTVEISDLIGIHKATVSRILSTLLEYGMVSQSDDTKKYILGPLAYRLGTSEASQFVHAFVAVASEHIDKLRDALMETISLELWTENKTVACYLAESLNPLQISMMPADVLPLHAPAGAKAILAFVSNDHLDRLLPEVFPKYTHQTITNKPDLLVRLAEFNRRGYSTDDEELYPGIYAIGVPIFDSLSKPVAAISAVMPIARITPERELEIVKQLKRTAKILSREIKGKRPLFIERREAPSEL